MMKARIRPQAFTKQQISYSGEIDGEFVVYSSQTTGQGRALSRVQRMAGQNGGDRVAATTSPCRRPHTANSQNDDLLHESVRQKQSSSRG